MGLLALFDHPVATIGSRFSYLLADGSSGRASRRSYRSCCCPGIYRAAAGSRSP